MVPDLLRAAADVIDTGWTRCKDIDPDTGGVCANGALRVAAGHTTTVDPFGRHRLDIPTDVSYEVACDMGKRIAATHAALSEYLAVVHNYEQAIPILPSIIRYNDNIAQSGSEVAGIMRAAATWVEAHPHRELAAVEEAAGKSYLYAKPPTPTLVAASV